METEPRDRYGAFLVYVDDWLSSTAIDLDDGGRGARLPAAPDARVEGRGLRSAG